MAVDPVTSTLGDTTLPDTGELAYNGVTFSSLYTSTVNGRVVPDEAHRTTKLMAWTINVDGVVTLVGDAPNTDASWTAIREKLSAHGAQLTYFGNGFGDLVVNAPNGVLFDVAWGPVPKVIDFKPLGDGRAALVKWQVTTQVPELPNQNALSTGNSPGVGIVAGVGAGRVLQFNYDMRIAFDSKGYCSLSMSGTLEIPLTRTTAASRTVSATVWDFRRSWLNIQVDLTKFALPEREFKISRDKRTCEFTFTTKELPRMGLPAGCTDADGHMNLKLQTLIAGVKWHCTLSASYAVRKDQPARVAALAFYALLWFRMWESVNAIDPGVQNPANARQQDSPGNLLNNTFDFTTQFRNGVIAGYAAMNQRMNAIAQPFINNAAVKPGTVILMDFNFDEGLYRSSDVMRFEATWVVLASFSSILAATGVWKWMGDTGGRVWATTVRDIAGYRSWLDNTIDPSVDVIVDFGGGVPPSAPLIGN